MITIEKIEMGWVNEKIMKYQSVHFIICIIKTLIINIILNQF